ncbi:putative Mn2+ efflux pump MntP [Paenibacillus rhizosphaerae]|uniref:Putative manganese efflux pump MntP n=1 Tax=Paenibacillus rhizosphaerae TaxID=297318 RepID=A0A839TZ66_9BACL|nr:manganese efflux pump [Paenibacillus rhizosphaerae]MBB3130840.1 putative Mn2+ efflux pump MntP [Paenibacillus rhizosphaerae]
MLETSAGLGQLMTIMIMAVALGLDAFSLGVGIGMKGIRLLHILKISLLIGLFHVLMPLLGMFMGYYVSSLLGQVAALVAGGLLVLLGGHMVLNSFKTSETRMVDHRSLLGMLLFSLSVSIDSFSVGVSLGMFESNRILTVLAFGICGGVMAVLGLLLGRRVSRNLGEYGEALGGAILLAFGLAFIF